VIRWPERPRPPADRLLGPRAAGDASASPVTLVIAFEPALDPAAIGELARSADRLLTIGWIGTHRDAREPELVRHWTLEEAARATALPTLSLRLGPLIGPHSPLWRVLARGAPGLQRDRLLMPLVEADAVETLRCAFAGDEPWDGWYEVAGPEAVTVGELVSWAAGGGAASPAAGWEPSPAILRAQRLADPEPWLRRFRLVPPPLAERVAGWAA
jgi:hypothetical protein